MVDGGLTKWVYDDGRTVEVPKECEWKKIIEKIYEEVSIERLSRYIIN